MGMQAYLRRANRADAQRLRADPRLVGAFIFGEQLEVVEDRMPGLLGFLLRFTPIKVEVARPAKPSDEPLWPSPAPGEMIGLDKAWHGLHFLLTGKADGGREPACFLLSGGDDLSDDDDVQARLLDPEQVQWFAEHLASLSTEELARRFDPERMTKLRIYPDVIWTRPEEEDEPRGYLLAAFTDLREFVAAAASAGDSIVVCIS